MSILPKAENSRSMPPAIPPNPKSLPAPSPSPSGVDLTLLRQFHLVIRRQLLPPPRILPNANRSPPLLQRPIRSHPFHALARASEYRPPARRNLPMHMHRAVRTSSNLNIPRCVAQLNPHRRRNRKRPIKRSSFRGSRRQGISGESCEEECSGKNGCAASIHGLYVLGEPDSPGSQALLVKDTQSWLKMFRPFWKGSRSATPVGNPLNLKPHRQSRPLSTLAQ